MVLVCGNQLWSRCQEFQLQSEFVKNCFILQRVKIFFALNAPHNFHPDSLSFSTRFQDNKNMKIILFYSIFNRILVKKFQIDR